MDYQEAIDKVAQYLDIRTTKGQQRDTQLGLTPLPEKLYKQLLVYREHAGAALDGPGGGTKRTWPFGVLRIVPCDASAQCVRPLRLGTVIWLLIILPHETVR